MNNKLGIIGAGKMGKAISGAVVREKLYLASEVGLYDVQPERMGRYREKGHTVYDSIEDLVGACGTILLAVKPQSFSEVLPRLKVNMTPEKLIVSIAAGISAERIQGAMGFPCKVVLAMPNSALTLSVGATALSRVEPTTPEEFERVKRLFTVSGIAEEIPPDKMCEVIPVNGSSPAFVYLFAKTLVDCAQRHGISRDAAGRLVSQTLIGAARMMQESGESHQELIDTVCTPGGTTIAAIEVLDRNEFISSIEEAFDACVDRARELSES